MRLRDLDGQRLLWCPPSEGTHSDDRVKQQLWMLEDADPLREYEYGRQSLQQLVSRLRPN